MSPVEEIGQLKAENARLWTALAGLAPDLEARIYIGTEMTMYQRGWFAAAHQVRSNVAAVALTLASLDPITGGPTVVLGPEGAAG